MARLLVFDFDSTLIKDESLVSLLKYTLRNKEPKLSEHELETAEKEIEQITMQGISGKISMIESYRKRLSIAKPTKQSVRLYLQNSNDLPTKGMIDVINRFRSEFMGVPIHVISQGPRVIVEPLSKNAFEIPSQNIHAVDLTIGDDDSVEYVAENEPILSRGKSKILEEIVQKEENNLGNSINERQKQIVIVGDGVSDMKMKVDGTATACIGFGVHLKIAETKKLSDYYVTDVEQLYPILKDLFSDQRRELDAHIREHKVFNFFAGPATIPTSVLKQVNDELLNYEHRLGYSVLEMSHRSKDFNEIINSASNNLRQLLDIPTDYEILYMQGGATLQFSAIPLNLCRPDQEETCDYLATGIWSTKAAEEATKCFGYTERGPSAVHVHKFDNKKLVETIEGEQKLKLSQSSRFLYYCDNETVNGTEFTQVPPEHLLSLEDQSNVRWVCDMSSNFLTRKFDIRRFEMIYSCAQKNFGVAGLTVVIIKKSLLGRAPRWLPSLLDFKVVADGQSLQNTPTTFSIYVADLVFEWMKDQGGIEEMDKRCREKSDKLYNYLDGEGSGFYNNNVPKCIRSRVNVVFRIVAHGDDKKSNEALEASFVKKANELGLVGLEGHRSVGGIRASLYNALPLKAVDELLLFMKQFQKEHKPSK